MDAEINPLVEYLAKAEADAFLFTASISEETADRFITLVRERSPRKSKVCLFITTYGGDPDAAYRIARCLRKNYKTVRVLIPGACKSAGTLVALTADELAFSSFGEIGPLDTQINKPDELLSRHSGLDILQSVDSIARSTFNCFETHMLRIIDANSGAISTKVASEIAIQLTIGMVAPITAQIDPVRLGSAQRAIDVAEAYGKRLAANSKNLKPDTLDQLINRYPAHGFVIDVDEAKELFHRVEEFNDVENRVFQLLYGFMRFPSADGIVLELNVSAAKRENEEGKTDDDSQLRVQPPDEAGGEELQRERQDAAAPDRKPEIADSIV